jgi:hypothetical protein
MRTLVTALAICLLLGCAAVPPEIIVGSDSQASREFIGADEITIYSLLPLETWNVTMNYPARAKHLLSLPTFHDFPVLGSFRVSSPAEVSSWASLLSTSFVDRPRTMCDFMPRHGVRLVRNGDTTDYLMCFSCGDLVVHFHGGHPTSHRPVWSLAVRERMNSELDRHHIERDSP